jgi:hypothetical protein
MEKRFFTGLMLFVFLLGLALSISFAHGQKTETQQTETQQTEEQKKAEIAKQNELKAKESKLNEFMGLSFGVSLSVTANFRQHPSIDEAEIINGTVYVLKEARAYARVMLESHYLYPLKPGRIGLGPFMAIQPTTGNLIGTLACGIMIGIKKEGTENNSFNIGLGFIVANDFQELTAGLVEGEKAPEGVSVVKYKKKTVPGACLIFSFSFKI